jgi:hypothetical protein
MNTRFTSLGLTAVALSLVSGCGGGSSSTTVAPPPPLPQTGTVSVSITDDPWHEMDSMVIRITGMDFGHNNGDVHSFDLAGGPMDVDMMQLQNGVFQGLMSDIEMPVGDYDWMRVRVDASQSHMRDRGTGGQHGFRMGPNAADGLEVHEPFQVQAGVHIEFMLDYDLRQGVRHSHGGMMGDQYELHSAMRLVHMSESGGLSGMVDPALIDVNHPDCDPAEGGNWVSEVESDGVPGPIAADRVEMDPGSGDHGYHFGFLPEGTYRVAFTCSGEWDEAGDDDYPSDPDGMFDFQAFSDPIDITAGQMHGYNL